jgi:diacylglycerol O-acyltransferase / wax synthase
MSNSERMSPVDTTWLRMDRPTNPMVVVGVLILAGPVDITRLQETLADRLTAIARFRQRAESHTTGMWWCADPQFDTARHIKRMRLPGAADKAELERFVAELVSTPLDPLHPLWQFHLIEDYAGGAALVVRIHHAIADGMALIAVLLSLMDGLAEAATALSAPHDDQAERFGVVAPLVDLLNEGLQLTGGLWRGSIGAAGNPAELLRQGTGIAAELAYLLMMPNDSPTRLKGRPAGTKRVAWNEPIALPEVKAVSHVLGCSVNDMLLAAVAGALHGYLADKGDATAGVEIRALVPVNLRPPGKVRELGNHFGVVALELPVGLDNPLARVHEIHRRMEALKHSYEPPVTLGLIAALGYAPQMVQDRVFDLLLSRATAVMTNVPGPQWPLHLAGSEVKQVMFWVPQAGDIGLGVSILSYNGKVQFGLMTDAALVPDPGDVVARFKPEFEKLLYFVLLGGAGEETEVPVAPPQSEAVAPIHAPPARPAAPARPAPARRKAPRIGKSAAPAPAQPPARIAAARQKSAGRKTSKRKDDDTAPRGRPESS